VLRVCVVFGGVFSATNVSKGMNLKICHFGKATAVSDITISGACVMRVLRASPNAHISSNSILINVILILSYTVFRGVPLRVTRTKSVHFLFL
jgi:hypothetical protein